MCETQRSKDQEQPSTDSKVHSELTLPLSTAQSGMWFMQKLISPDSTFNIAEAIEIHGPIDPALFEIALRQMAMEAESVRVRLIETHDGPKLTVTPTFDGQIPFFDVSAEADPREAAWRWMKAECAKPVDLLVGPLWTSALFKLTPEHFIWYHCCHHIILDGFSGGLMTRRAASLYSALVEKRPASDDDAFGSLNILFEEEKAYRNSTRFMRDREYWMQRFADQPKPVSLATRHSPNVDSPIRQTIHLSADRASVLRSFARTSGVSLPQLMIASIAAYLYRVTGMEDLVVGMTVTGRANSRVRQVPGMMANVLPLRLSMTPNLTVAELLIQVSKEVRQVLRHQSYRYEDLRRDLHLMVAQSQHLFATVINIEPFDYDLRFAGHPVTPHNLSNASAENLAVFVYDRGDEQGLCIDFDANSALYCVEELVEHQERLVKFIESMILNADQPISRIEILTPEERQRLLIDWNATKADYPQYCCIHELFEAQVRNTPDAVAVVFEDQQLTYAELNSRANRLAHHLRSLGVKPEARVAICLERSFEMVVGLLAVLKAGGAYVPLDPSYPEDRLAYMLTDSAPQALLTLGNLAANFLAAAPELPVVDLAEAEQWAHQSVENPDSAAFGLTPRHLAYVIYTSGSTGKPKGAMNEHRGVVNRLHWMQKAYGLTPDDAVLQKTPFSFDVSVWEFFWPLLTGARLVMARPEGHKDPSYLADVIRQNNITTLHFVPSMLQVFLEHPAAASCSSLIRVMCSGEALPEPFARRFQERLPHAGLHNLYGPTEAAVDVTSWMYTPDFSGTSIPLGRPIANTQIYILDEQGEPAPTGVEGEIFIGGVQVGRGYLDRPDLTAERFVPDPFGKPGARMYRTGDLGRWQADGTLEYLGRNDFQVKIRGFRIELGEIEAQLASHPDVREAAVMTRESPTGDPRLIAYYSAETTLATMSLRSYLSERMPDYMVPAVFVWLDAFPLSPNGKLDRKALPVDIGLRQDRVAIAPRNQHELQITQIWQSIFGQDDLSIDDNFFELGGHSLQAVQMIAKIEAELGKQLPLVSLFKAPTIEQLARLISDDPSDEMWEPVVKLYAGGSGSPVFCVSGVGGQCHSLYHLAVALGKERPVYAFQPYGLDGCNEPHTSIEEMAAYYLDLMLEIQPAGPYHLVGHSFGGCVAFEMAKRLEASGREVGFVALLDSGIPSGSDATDAALNVQSLKALAYVYGREITIDAEALEGLAEEEQLKLIRPHLVELGVVREDSGLNMVRGLMNISRAQVRMSYQPDGVPVQQILFIQAEERRFNATIELLVLERAVAQWKRLSKRPFVHVHVPGDHFSILDQKNAHKVAAILQSWMALEESDIIETEELTSEVA